jgi:hypothetical protein
MTKEEFIADKKIALLENRKRMADEIIAGAKLVLSTLPKRKSAFRKKDRLPKRNRLSTFDAMFQTAAKVRVLHIQDAIIRSQPIPKYPHGRPAIVGEASKEIIITPSRQYTTPCE